MARPRHCRFVEHTPASTYFTPCGVALNFKDIVTLPIEGLEALRLCDLEGLSTSCAAQKMRVSRSTFSRTLEQARKAVAQTLVHGKVLKIEGGSYELAAQTLPSPKKDSCLLAVSSEGPSLDDRVDPRFGRAGGFVVLSLPRSEKSVISYLDNGDAQILPHGAGILTGRNLAQAGVTHVISGSIGTKAVEELQKLGIVACEGYEGLLVREAVARFEKECLPGISSKKTKTEEYTRA